MYINIILEFEHIHRYLVHLALDALAPCNRLKDVLRLFALDKYPSLTHEITIQEEYLYPVYL